MSAAKFDSKTWALGIVSALLLSFVSAAAGSAWQAEKIDSVATEARSARQAARENTVRLEAAQRDYALIRQELSRLNEKMDRMLENDANNRNPGRP